MINWFCNCYALFLFQKRKKFYQRHPNLNPKSTKEQICLSTSRDRGCFSMTSIKSRPKRTCLNSSLSQLILEMKFFVESKYTIWKFQWKTYYSNGNDLVVACMHALTNISRGCNYPNQFDTRSSTKMKTIIQRFGKNLKDVLFVFVQGRIPVVRGLRQIQRDGAPLPFMAIDYYRFSYKL